MPNQGFGQAGYTERPSSAVDRVGKIAMTAISRDGKTSTAVIGLALALAVVGQLLLDYRTAVPVAAGLCLLAVGALYLLARQLGGVPVAFAAAGLLAVSRWHLSYSRLGYEAIIGPLCAALTIYFLLRALRERRPGLFAASGLAMGTGLYTYIAYRLFPLALGPAGIVAPARPARRAHRV